MAYYKHLTTVFFATRCLRKLNKANGFSLQARDIKVMFFLFSKGTRSVGNLCSLNSWQVTQQRILPKLLENDLVKIDGKLVEITTRGIVVLQKYNQLLAKSRMDRINKWTETKRKQDKYWYLPK